MDPELEHEQARALEIAAQYTDTTARINTLQWLDFPDHNMWAVDIHTGQIMFDATSDLNKQEQ